MSQTDSQDSTGQTDNGPIAQGEPFYKRSAKKGAKYLTKYGVAKCLRRGRVFNYDFATLRDLGGILTVQ